MNHKKLNQLFKRDYIPDSGGSNDDYEPSQLFTPTKKCRCDEENSSLLPPCPSALASRNANEEYVFVYLLGNLSLHLCFSLAHSGVFDNDVSPQEFIEQLCASKGINLTILQSADLKDGASDIDNEEFGVESQKQELYESSPPPLPSQALSAHPVCMCHVYLRHLFMWTNDCLLCRSN